MGRGKHSAKEGKSIMINKARTFFFLGHRV